MGSDTLLHGRALLLRQRDLLSHPHQIAPPLQLVFLHVVEHLGTVAALVHGEGTAEARAWVAAQARALHDDGPAPPLAALAACQARGPCADARPDAEGRTLAEQLAREVGYFATRAAQLAYPAFRARGYPIGSGIAESGHKVVVSPRCKRAGQHWADRHLTPLLALRCASCNDRWGEVWPALWAEQRRQAASARSPPRPKLVVNGRPTAAHSWRAFRFGTAPHPGG